MRQNILRKLNFILFIFIALFIVVAQSTLLKYFPFNYLQPDLVIILSVYFGFKRGIIEGGILTILASLIMEGHSSVPPFFMLTAYLYTFLIAKILSRMIVVPHQLTVISITMGVTIFWKILILILLSSLNKAGNGVKHIIIYLLPTLAIQGFLTPIFWRFYGILDLITYKDIHAEDEYDINREF